MKVRSVETHENLTFRLRVRQWLWVQTLRYRSWKRKSLARPVFILSFPRTGSSLLLRVLAQCTDLADCGEILNQRIGLGLTHSRTGLGPVVSHIRRNLGATASAFAVIKLHFNHLEKRGVSVADVVKHFPNALFLLLYRKALLEQYCSMKLASETRTFVGSIRSSQDLVQLDVDEWESFREKILGKYHETVRAFESRGKESTGKMLLVSYESLRDGQMQGLLLDLQCWGLNCSGLSLQRTSLVKQETRSIEQIVDNYNQVASRLGVIEVRCFP